MLCILCEPFQALLICVIAYALESTTFPREFETSFFGTYATCALNSCFFFVVGMSDRLDVTKGSRQPHAGVESGNIISHLRLLRGAVRDLGRCITSRCKFFLYCEQNHTSYVILGGVWKVDGC
jgi:hypothetical protein